MSQKTIVFATFRCPGFHRWTDAPGEYAYLRAPHRHVFHVRIECRVDLDDRQVEFIRLSQDAETMFKELTASEDMLYGAIDFGGQSCEMLCNALYVALADPMKYHIVLDGAAAYNITAIEVSEDGENGARVTFAA